MPNKKNKLNFCPSMLILFFTSTKSRQNIFLKTIYYFFSILYFRYSTFFIDHTTINTHLIEYERAEIAKQISKSNKRPHEIITA